MPPSTRKPSRRKAKQDRSRATVDAIVEASARVLLREGYARATTNRIAETAGVGIGTLYRYFDGKEEIFDALLARETGRIVATVEALDPAPERPLESVLGALLAGALAAAPHGAELYRRLRQLPGDAFTRRLDLANERLAAVIRRLLEAHREQLRVTDLDVAAFVVLHAAEALGLNAPRDLGDARLAAEATDLLSRYLLETPPARD